MFPQQKPQFKKMDDYNIDLKDEMGSYSPQTNNQPVEPERQTPVIEQPVRYPEENLQAEKKDAPTGCTRFCSLDFYEQFFQVTQSQVLQRITISLIPNRRDFIENIRDGPDFYGPFWILTTIIFLLGSAGNLSRYLFNWGAAESQFNMSLIRIGVLIVYPFGFGVPTLLYFVLKFAGGSRISLPQLICVYGYSFSMFVIILILCVIPSVVLQWLLMVVGMFGTIAFLVLNLMEYLDDLVPAKKYVFFGIIGGAQITLFLVFKLVFFNMVYAATQAVVVAGVGNE